MTGRPAGAQGEDRLIRWLRNASGGEASPIGDDAALLSVAPGRAGDLAVTVDHQIEGVHFPAGTDPAIAARRLLAVNLSDLAAVGAEPRYALLALAAARGFDHRRFLRALGDACRRHGIVLAGGDLSSLPADAPALSSSLTLLGGRPAGGGWVRRHGAAAGDELWVGGTLGESALGRHLLARGARWSGRAITLPSAWKLTRRQAAAARRAVRRHLAPQPQLALGLALGRHAARRHPPAALDISDGLVVDLTRLCRASGVGADLDLTSLPIGPGCEELARRFDLDPRALALGGGEDYVLLFSAPAGSALTQNAPEGCARIGRFTASGALRGFEEGLAGGKGRPLPATGWDHLDPYGYGG